MKARENARCQPFNCFRPQNGPARLTWPNGATREGCKSGGQWHGEVIYTYAEGPRKGKSDKEAWDRGKLQGAR